MAIQQQDIDIFLNRAQQRIAKLGTESIELEEQGLCIKNNIDLIQQLSSAICFLQDLDDDITDDEIWEAISVFGKKGELNEIPFANFDCSCLVENVFIGGGYLLGPAGPTGPVGPAGPQGPAGADGANGANGLNGTNGWSPVFAVVQDGQRLVVRVNGWTGGTGTPPSSGLYIGSSGLVSLIADAVDIRGTQGLTGATGAAGPQGNAGQSSYTYIAYASDSNGTGFTTTFNSSLEYIGIKTTTVPLTPSSSDFVGLWFKWKGEQGSRFIIDELGPTSDLSIWDAEPKGFNYFDTDNGVVYTKLTNTPGDWGGPYAYQGFQGWSPVFAVVSDGDRRVLQITDWVNGEGAKPSVVNQYIGPTGIVNTIAEAVDVRGEKGERFYPDQSGIVADRSFYDASVKDFVFYATDTGQVAIKLSNTSGDWSSWYDWRGPQGPVGPVGGPGNGYNEDCQAGTTSNLATTYDPVGKTLTATSNGVLSVDGVSPAVNNRILVFNQSTASQNGIYVVTSVGSLSSPYILTRAGDFDSSIDAKKFRSVYIQSGTVNAGRWYTYTNERSAVVLDTTGFVFKRINHPMPWIGLNKIFGNTSGADPDVPEEIDLIQEWVTAPATSSGAGFTGQKAQDGTYIYFCYATNSWARVSATFSF